MTENDSEYLAFEAHCKEKKLGNRRHPLHLIYLEGDTQRALTHFHAGYEAGKKETPNDHWRKVTDELPKIYEEVLLKYPDSARRVGAYCGTTGFHAMGAEQDWLHQPIEWMPWP